MSEREENKADEVPIKSSSRPSHVAYSVREGAEGKSYFNRVGAAFAHKDGQGFNIKLRAVPVNGQITLRTPQERLDQLKDGSSKGAEREPIDHEQ